MSHTIDWLPQNHQALFDKATHTLKYLLHPDNRDRMGFGADTPQGNWLTETFIPAFEAFRTMFNDWVNPAERTAIKVARLRSSEKAFKPLYRQLYVAFLKRSPLVTDSDMTSMELPTRHHSGRRAVATPDTFPAARSITSELRRITIEFYGSGVGKHHRAKPAGVHGAEICWEVFDSLHPVYLEELTQSSFVTHSPLVLEFKENERSKVLYFALRWENSRGEKGPFGPVLNAVIP
ncbi:MAG: hypothetical protein LBF90_04925 [Prevotellaceae bacterium]|jgi:hypothetical protein|nr:hypothetical protein [Prevotellaceae bacterium]